MKHSKKTLLLGGILIAASLAACNPAQSSSSEDTQPSSSITEKSVTGISLNAATLEVEIGKTAQLTATVTPSDATNKAVTWSSANPQIASVSDDGIVTGVATGTTLITVTSVDGGRTASCAVTVKANTVAVTGVNLNVDSLELVEGETETLVATVLPENATNKAVEWSSDNKSKVTVDQNGVVTAVEAGEAFITVRTSDGGFEKSVEVIVTAKPEVVVPLTAVSIASSTGLSMVPVGAAITLTPSFTPENTTEKGLIWESSDEEVATVSGGIVTGRKAGTATIKATSSVHEDISATFVVTVEETVIKLTKVEITNTSGKMYIGDQLQLVGVLTPENTTENGIAWLSNNESVATVDSHGLVTAIASGSATITMQPTDNSSVEAATIVIEVSKRPVPVTKIEIVTEEPVSHIYVGDELQLSSVLTPYDTTDTGVVWTSSNTDAATIDSASGKVIGVAEGETTIKCASVNAPSIYAELPLKVFQSRNDNKNIAVTTFDGPSSIETSFRNNTKGLDSVDPAVLKAKAANPATREENTFFQNEEGTSDTYKVGSLNPFKLSFTASGLDEDFKTTTIDNLVLNVALYERDGSTFSETSSLGTYATVNDAKTSYQFNESAVGKVFKLRVEPDKTAYASVSQNCYFEHVFEVVKGYNVYNWADLTKMDNRADNYYQENAATGETAKVDTFILHKDLTVVNSDIPAAMKWTEDKAQEYIDGHSADWQSFINKIMYDEDSKIFYTYEYQKEDGTYANKTIDTKKEAKEVFVDSLIDNCNVLVHELADGETFTFEGNYFNIDYSHVEPVIFFDDADDGLLSNYLTSEGGHASFFSRDSYNECVGQYTWKNFSSKGNGTRSANDVSPAGGLILLKEKAKIVDVCNVLAYSTFTTFIIEDYDNDKKRGTYNFDRVKAFDSYNIMFYNWGSTMNVTNSIAMRAGGALMINDEINAVGDDRPNFRSANTTVSNSYLESWVSGSEAWFSTKNASSLVQMMTTIGGPNGFIGKNRGSFGNHNTFVEKKTLSTGEAALYANLVAIDVHARKFAGNTYSEGHALEGSFKIDGVTALDMKDLAVPGKDIATYKAMMDANSAQGFFFTGSQGGSAAQYAADGSEAIHWQNGLSALNPAFANDCVTFSTATTAIEQLNAAGAEPATQAATALQNSFNAFYSSDYLAGYLSPAYGLNYLGILLGCGNYVIS